MRRTLLFLLLPLVAWPAAARADSIFDAAYFGGSARRPDARAAGRAGTSLAFQDSLSAAVTVATQLVDLRMVTVSVTGEFTSTSSQDPLGEVSRRGLTVPSLRVGMPVGSRAGFGFGFSAARSTQWTVERPNANQPEIPETLEREGTQFEVPFEVGVRVHRHLRVSAGIVLERGTTRQRYLADVPDGVDPAENREETLKSTAFRFGLAAPDLGPVSLAGFYVPQHDGTVDVRTRGVALDNRADVEREETRPQRWGAGLRVDLPRQWSVGFDAESEHWADYEGRVFLDENGKAASFNNETTLRWGVERSPDRRGEGAPLRAGAYWRRWNYRLGGEYVEEWGVTVGTGLSLRTPNARADLAIGYSSIGSAAADTAEENVIRLVFSISGGERWY